MNSKVLTCSVLALALRSVVATPIAPGGQFHIDYCADHAVSSDDTITLRIDDTCGSRWRTPRRFSRGAFQARVRVPGRNASGLVTSLYLSTLEGPRNQSEIDFEWLGKDPTAVQTNYYVKGKGGNEVLHPLGFDASKRPHTYTIVYQRDLILWLVDCKIIREEQRGGTASLPGGFPGGPVYLYGSVWDASAVDGGSWSGVYVPGSGPHYARYADVRVPA